MDKQFSMYPLLPVVTGCQGEDAVWLAKVLLDCGIPHMELTLRHPKAFDTLKRVQSKCPEMKVGLGTVTNVSELTRAYEANVSFVVSPGLLPFMATQADIYSMPFMPGVATVSEAMQAFGLGLKHLKLFPANVIGGVDFLKAVHTVLPKLTFCPSGGVNLKNIADYLALPNVPQVALSALAPFEVVKERDKLTLVDTIRAYQAKANSLIPDKV